MSSIQGKAETNRNSANSTSHASGTSSVVRKPVPTRLQSEVSVANTEETYVLASEGSDADFAAARDNAKPLATSPQEALDPGHKPAAQRSSRGVGLSAPRDLSARRRAQSAPPASRRALEATASGSGVNETTGHAPESAASSPSSSVVRGSPAPSYGHIEDAPPPASPLLPNQPAQAPLAGPQTRPQSTAPAQKPAAASAPVMRSLVAQGIQAIKRVHIGKLVWKILNSSLTYKLAMLGVLIGCTATFACLAVVSGGLFAGGLILLLAATFAMAGVTLEPYWPIIKALAKAPFAAAPGSERN